MTSASKLMPLKFTTETFAFYFIGNTKLHLEEGQLFCIDGMKSVIKLSLNPDSAEQIQIIPALNKIGRVIGATFRIFPEAKPSVSLGDSLKVRFSESVDILCDRGSVRIILQDYIRQLVTYGISKVSFPPNQTLQFFNLESVPTLLPRHEWPLVVPRLKREMERKGYVGSILELSGDPKVGLEIRNSPDGKTYLELSSTEGIISLILKKCCRYTPTSFTDSFFYGGNIHVPAGQKLLICQVEKLKKSRAIFDRVIRPYFPKRDELQFILNRMIEPLGCRLEIDKVDLNYEYFFYEREMVLKADTSFTFKATDNYMFLDLKELFHGMARRHQNVFAPKCKEMMIYGISDQEHNAIFKALQDKGAIDHKECFKALVEKRLPLEFLGFEMEYSIKNMRLAFKRKKLHSVVLLPQFLIIQYDHFTMRLKRLPRWSLLCQIIDRSSDSHLNGLKARETSSLVVITSKVLHHLLFSPYRDFYQHELNKSFQPKTLEKLLEIQSRSNRLFHVFNSIRKSRERYEQLFKLLDLDPSSFAEREEIKEAAQAIYELARLELQGESPLITVLLPKALAQLPEYREKNREKRSLE